MQIVKVKKGARLNWMLIFTTREEQDHFGEDLRHLDKLDAVYYHDSAYKRGHIELSKPIL
ncbi:hypothetical protein ES703_109692 [subsurface metagenome]